MKTVLAIALVASLTFGLNACAATAESQGDAAAEHETTDGQEAADESEASADSDEGKLDSRDIMHAAAEEYPLPSEVASNVLVKLEEDGVRPVVFKTELGEFIYYVDVYTGEVVDKVEPEYTEEDLERIRIITSKEAKDAVFAVSPIPAKLASHMSIKLMNNTWVVDFDSDYGHFRYVVDAKTAEILDKEESEVPEEIEDPMDLARDACLATLDGYDGSAKNMTLTLKGQKNKVVYVEFDWKGEHYSMEYDVSSKTITTK